MAVHKSVLKRRRQNIKRRDRNRANLSRMRTSVKRFRKAIDAGDPSKAREILQDTSSIVQKTASKGTIHRRKAARIICRLAKAFNNVQA